MDDRIKKLAGVNEFKGYTEYTLENISDAANRIVKNEMKRILSQVTMNGLSYGSVYLK